MMRHAISMVFLGLSLCSASIFAQEVTRDQDGADAADAPQVVQVSGVKNPELKPYRQMLKGIDAFHEHHQLAPQAELRFKLLAKSGAVTLEDATLRIAGDSTSIPVPVAKDGTFLLPRNQAAADDNADIVSNKKKSLLRWRADIHSPNVPGLARRLGDLRLECETSWAINRDDMSFFVRNGIALVGGLCRSKQITLNYEAPQPLSAVALVSGQRRESLPVDSKNRRVFSPPLADGSWNDDALIEYEFAASANNFPPAVAPAPGAAVESK